MEIIDYFGLNNYRILPKLADVNNDTFVDVNDVPTFVQRLTDPAGYAAAFPEVHDAVFDFNGDGNIDGRDIQGFVDRVLLGP